MGNVEKAFGEHQNLGSRLHLYKEGEKPTRERKAPSGKGKAASDPLHTS